MINPNELRIGNLVYCNTAKLVVKVQWPHPAHLVVDIKGPFVHCDHTDGDLEEFDPIPLTPEWLGRCGFEDDKHGRWTGPQFETDNTIQWFEIEEDDKQKGFYWLRGSEWVMGRPFQFLHQLQNLYHALVGEELTIKEPA